MTLEITPVLFKLLCLVDIDSGFHRNVLVHPKSRVPGEMDAGM
jgi:hypothetical protein